MILGVLIVYYLFVDFFLYGKIIVLMDFFECYGVNIQDYQIINLEDNNIEGWIVVLNKFLIRNMFIVGFLLSKKWFIIFSIVDNNI